MAENAMQVYLGYRKHPGVVIQGERSFVDFERDGQRLEGSRLRVTSSIWLGSAACDS